MVWVQSDNIARNISRYPCFMSKFKVSLLKTYNSIDIILSPNLVSVWLKLSCCENLILPQKNK